MKIINASFVLGLVSLFASSVVANTWHNATITLLSDGNHYTRHINGKFGELFTELHANLLVGVSTTVNAKVANALKPVYGHQLAIFRKAEIAKLPAFIDAAFLVYKTPLAVATHLEAFLDKITNTIISDLNTTSKNPAYENAIGPPLILAARAHFGTKYTKAIGATILANLHNTIVLWRSKQIATFCYKYCSALEWRKALDAVLSAKY